MPTHLAAFLTTVAVGGPHVTDALAASPPASRVLPHGRHDRMH